MTTQPSSITCDLFRRLEQFRGAGVQNRPGCYAIFNSECLYVGRAQRLVTRIMCHWIDQRDGNGRQWRLAGVVEWYNHRPFAPAGSSLQLWYSDDEHRLERGLIESLSPVHNAVKYRTALAQDRIATTTPMTIARNHFPELAIGPDVAQIASVPALQPASLESSYSIGMRPMPHGKSSTPKVAPMADAAGITVKSLALRAPP